MKNNVILSGIIGAVLIFGTLECQAAKWDKNSYADDKVASGFYDVASIKVKGNVVSWTEKYILTSGGMTSTGDELSKHEVCKENIAIMGNVTQFQLDYQIEKGKFRGVAKRYYNKENKLICTNNDTATEFNKSWSTILRGSPMQQAQYDLVTKYKIKFP
jgi:hypothetical protein